MSLMFLPGVAGWSEDTVQATSKYSGNTRMSEAVVRVAAELLEVRISMRQKWYKKELPPSLIMCIDPGSWVPHFVPPEKLKFRRPQRRYCLQGT